MSQRAHGQSKLCEWKSSLQYSNVESPSLSPNSELYFDINFRLQVLLIVDSKSSLSRALKSVQEQKKWGKNDMLQRHWNKEERLKKAEGERLCQVCTFTNSKYVLFLPNKRTYLMDPTILKINHETTTKNILSKWLPQNHSVYYYHSVPQIHPPFGNLSLNTKCKGAYTRV